MSTLPRLAQQIHRAACDHFTAMTNKGFDDFLEVQYFRLAIDQGNHIDAKN